MRIERSEKTGVARTIALQGPAWAQVREHVPNFMEAWLPSTTLLSKLGFHPFNGITGYAQGNGISTSRGFDIAGRLTALKVEQLSDQTLSYEVGPRIRGIEDKVSTYKASFDYSGFGALKQNPALVRTSAGEFSEQAERDALGRTASDAHLRYTYTASGHVETVSTRDGKLIARYRYNAAGQRVSKTVQEADGAKTTYFLWHDRRLAAEIEGSGERRGEVTAQYLYLTQGGQVIPIAS